MRHFVPISKIDSVERMIYGVMAEESPDKSGEIFDYETGKAAVEAWSDQFKRATAGKSLGNIRVMHRPDVAAGLVTKIQPDDGEKNILIAAHIVDDQEWEKAEKGVYTGFSIGGDYANKWPDPKDESLTRYTPVIAECSLVDNPCMAGATFTHVKSDGTSELLKFEKQEPEEEAPAEEPKEEPKEEPADNPGEGQAPAVSEKAAAVIVSLKDLLAAMGDDAVTDTVGIHDIADAISSMMGVKFFAEDQGMGTEASAVMEMAVKLSDLHKQEPKEPEAPQPEPDPDPQQDDLSSLKETLGKIEAAVQESKEGFEGKLSKQVAESVEKATKDLLDTVKGLTAKVETVEKSLAPVGTKPVQKTVGLEIPAEGDETTVAHIEKAVIFLEKHGGLTDEQKSANRMALATASVPKV